MVTTKYTLPIYWASYLVNGDDSGIDEAEKAVVDRFLADTLGHCIDAGEDYWFQQYNDATDIGGDVCEYIFLSKE